MLCPKCRIGDLEITHTYSVAHVGEARRASCPHCYAVVTLETRPVQIDPPRNKGAQALARQMESSLAPKAIERTEFKGGRS